MLKFKQNAATTYSGAVFAAVIYTYLYYFYILYFYTFLHYITIYILYFIFILLYIRAKRGHHLRRGRLGGLIYIFISFLYCYIFLYITIYIYIILYIFISLYIRTLLSSRTRPPPTAGPSSRPLYIYIYYFISYILYHYIFEQNAATTYGGAVFAAYYSYLDLPNASFVANVANLSGGAVYLDANCSM